MLCSNKLECIYCYSFRHSLILLSKDWAYPSVAPGRRSTPRLERLARNKQTSYFVPNISCKENIIHNFGVQSFYVIKSFLLELGSHSYIQHNDTQHSDIKHYDTEHNDIQQNNKLNMTLSIMVECCYAECQ